MQVIKEKIDFWKTMKKVLNESILNDASSKKYLTMHIEDVIDGKLVIDGEIFNGWVYCFDELILSKYQIKNEIYPFNCWHHSIISINQFFQAIESKKNDSKFSSLNKIITNRNFFYNDDLNEINEILEKYVFEVEETNDLEYNSTFYVEVDASVKKKKKSIRLRIIDLARDFIKRSNNILEKRAFCNLLTIDDNLVPNNIISYRVGQGSFNIINYTNGIQMAYDIGFGHENSKLPCFANAISTLNSLSCDYVLVSHTDQDHIKGTININKSLYKNAKWIFPKKIHNTAFACRILIRILYDNPKGLFFIDRINPVVGSNLKIFQGNGKKTLHCNKKNALGLLLFLKNNNEALLCGDCLYGSIPSSYVKNYNFLLVPHHCCKLDSKTNNCFKGSPNNQFATICVGKSKNHPEANHLKKLKKHYTVFDTRKFDETQYDFSSNSVTTK